MNNGQLPAAPLHNDKLVKAFMEVEQVAPNGLTKREHFAGLAMQGLLSEGPFPSAFIDVCEYKLCAEAAVMQADALLKELAK